ncbi:hypothetical protein [Streptomyces nigrescens]|uniref:hypothetical protein n=1 Tax=Streptomyces nigrescens TaxID=1920 RepID=UPI0036F99622
MNDQHDPRRPVSEDGTGEPGDLPADPASSSADAERPQLVALTAQAIDQLHDAIVAGQEDPSHELLCAMDRLHEARARGISIKEITAARRDGGAVTVYRVAHRTHGEDPLPYLSKPKAFDKCEARVLREQAGADLQWGTESADGQASRTSPWVLFRLDARGDLIDTGYTVTPLPTTVTPVPGVFTADEQS